MRKVSIVEDYTQLKNSIICKSYNVEKCRKDIIINSSGIWETYLEYGDYAKEMLMGYLIIRKGDPTVPMNYSYLSEMNFKEDSLFNMNIYQKLTRQHTCTTLLLESAEIIAKEEHESKKIAVNYEQSNSATFRRLGYEQEDNLMTKELNDVEQLCFLSLLNCMDLRFDENKNLIRNPIDADAAEQEWLKKHDEEYRQNKTCSL